MLKEGGIVSALTWALTMLKSSARTRMKHFKIAIEGLLHRNKDGKITKENEEMVEYLLNDAEFIGFTPNISYIMPKGGKEELDNLWVHPFSVPTLLFKVKDKPLLIVANANLDYNDSVLSKIEHNKYSKQLISSLKNIRGITG